MTPTPLEQAQEICRAIQAAVPDAACSGHHGIAWASLGERSASVYGTLVVDGYWFGCTVFLHDRHAMAHHVERLTAFMAIQMAAQWLLREPDAP